MFAITSRSIAFGALFNESGKVCGEAGDGRAVQGGDIGAAGGGVSAQIV
jgi:hypothetical protein